MRKEEEEEKEAIFDRRLNVAQDPEIAVKMCQQEKESEWRQKKERVESDAIPNFRSRQFQRKEGAAYLILAPEATKNNLVIR